MFSFRFLNQTALPLVLAGCAGLSMNAMAHEEEAQAPVNSSTVPADAPDNSMVVVKDATTGELRLPTPEELAALQTPANARARAAAVHTVASQPLQKFHANGARGARMTPEFMSFVVATRQADGSFAMRCFENRQQAEAAIQQGGVQAGKPSQAPTE